MTTNLTLRGRTNQTFQITFDLSQFVNLGDLATATLRMATAGFSWVSGAASGGVIYFDAESNYAFVCASEASIAAAALASANSFDFRIEFANGWADTPITGVLYMAAGIAQSTSDPTALASPIAGADTVTIDGYTAPAPYPVPASLVRSAAALAGPSITLDFSTPGDWMFA